MVDSWTYENKSGVHGLALSPSTQLPQLIYSADLSADYVWTHSVNSSGQINEVGRIRMPNTGMHPRHLAVHPNGTYLYVVMEAGNALAQVRLDRESGLASGITVEYSLIRPSELRYPHAS